MAEHFIAIGVGCVVGGGILTLVYRILTSGREAQRLDDELDKFARKPEPAKDADKPKKKKN